MIITKPEVATVSETCHEDAYVRLAPLLQPAVPDQVRPEMSWIIGSTKHALVKAKDVFGRQF